MANKDLNATVALNAEALADLLQQVKQLQQGQANAPAAAVAAETAAENESETEKVEELPPVVPQAARRPPLPAARSWFRR